MKQTITMLCLLSALAIACGPKLEQDEVKRLLEDVKAYPAPVELRIYCNESETAKQIKEKGLEEQGLVIAQLAHTVSDVGKPLIYFTAAAEPYLLPTSDTLKAFDVQKVKVADEEFHGVSSTTYAEDGKSALVTFTTRMTNLTPFAAMYPQSLENEHPRQTMFTLTPDGWQWNGEITKLNPAYIGN